MEGRVEEAMSQLIAAVEAAMDPQTIHQKRLEAYQAFEEFKETSPLCAQCGLTMAATCHNHLVRHAGLQLLEHCVKFRWNKLSPEEKQFLKTETMKLIQMGTEPLLREEAHIKDALSRIVVEMVKREWPQQWPTLLKELNTLCSFGATQTELVLLVFLRLAEDVLIFQTVPTQRRREIMQALTSEMAGIFTYFVSTLKNTFESYKSLKGSARADGEQTEAAVQCQVAQAVLHTLAGFVDWINMTYIIQDNGLLLQLLCLMLCDNNLQLSAAECLLIITNRKGKIEERKPLLILFSEDAMSVILNAAVTAANAGLDEHHYIFLKRLCQVLTTVGTQLATLWGSFEDVSRPANFDSYLQAIIAFTQHPSQSLCSYTQSLWATFLRQEHICTDHLFLQFVPKLMQTATTKLLKLGFPSQDNCPSCAYSRLDFDSDEDFNFFFSKYRAEIAETIRLATVIAPTVTFQVAAQWLHSLLKKPLDIGAEWDALTVFLECVITRLKSTDRPTPPVESGLDLLQAVLSYDTQDPLILSSVLSCISALFPYITHAPDILPAVLDKIFSTAVFSIEGQTKATRSKAVRNVRRHACSVLVKICKQYPQLLLPGFIRLREHINKLSSDPEQLSQMEKCTLIEALILISNEFRDFEKQCSFLGEILQPVKALWLSPQLIQALWSADNFITYVGLDQAAVEPSSEDTCGINRSHITYCINTILAVEKRSRWPDDPMIAEERGFVLSQPNSGTVVMRNPAMPHLITMLDNVLTLIRTLNALWSPEQLQRRHPQFEKAYDLLEVDKQTLLGIPPPCVDNTDSTFCKQPLERMQFFLSSIHENCYHILGCAGEQLGQQFYQSANLASSLLHSVFTNLQLVPDYRLRPCIRTFLKPYMLKCPKELYRVALVPVLEVLCPYMVQRLSSKWQVINQQCHSSDDANAESQEPEAESQEVLEEQLVRQLSRDYVDFLGAVLRERRGADATDEVQMEDAETATAPPTSTREETSLSELGLLLFQTESVFPSVVQGVFAGLGWKDTTTCHRCVGLAWPILKQLVAEKRLSLEDASHLFMGVLQSLQIHGQHEGSQAMLVTLALQSYELLRPVFPHVQKILLEIPSCKPASLQSFDEKLQATAPSKPQSDKKKKDHFKKLVQDIIGTNIGQQFKKEVVIKNLPALFKSSHRHSMPSLDAQDPQTLSLCALFDPHTNTSSS